MKDRRLSSIEDLACEGRVAECLDELKVYFTENKDFERLSWLKTVESDYLRMLDYFLTGNPDPYRLSLHSKTVADILSVVADCRRDIRVADSTDLFATKARFENLQGHTLRERLDAYFEALKDFDIALIEDPDKAEALRKKRDDLLSLYFYKLWTAKGLTQADVKMLTSVLSSTERDFILQAQTVNALLLRCMEFFDSEVILMLADIAESSRDERILARALTALILLMTRHRKRLEGNEMIRLRFDNWHDNLIMYRRLREVLTALIKTRDTARISDTMESEVIPGLMQMRPEIMKKMRDKTADFDPSMIEENPEWEEMLEKTGLSSKLRELSELQSEGADVMMVAFSQLKNHPFFNELSNWLMPFDMENNNLSKLREMNLIGLENFFESPAIPMCDSDKYSFAFSLMSMPEQQRDSMLGQLDAQLTQFSADHDEKLLKTSTPEFDREANMYVRDLYRFYKLNPRHQEFINPFERVSDFTHLPVIGEILMQSDIIEIAGEYFFRHGYYKEALKVFLDIERHQNDDRPRSDRYEKIGFCYQKLGEFETALKYYDKAALIAPESKWLQRKLAYCNRQCGNFQEGAKLYRKILETTPDNLNIICNLADCLAAEGDTEGALKEYYKADYLHPGNHKVERAIAWNEMISGHYDKSMRYHKLVLSADPERRDYINAGHTHLLSGNPADAVREYSKARKLYGDIKDFIAAIEADFEILQNNGQTKADLRLLMNAILMK